jgi:hypothetical protein
VGGGALRMEASATGANYYSDVGGEGGGARGASWVRASRELRSVVRSLVGGVVGAEESVVGSRVERGGVFQSSGGVKLCMKARALRLRWRPRSRKE